MGQPGNYGGLAGHTSLARTHPFLLPFACTSVLAWRPLKKRTGMGVVAAAQVVFHCQLWCPSLPASVQSARATWMCPPLPAGKGTRARSGRPAFGWHASSWPTVAHGTGGYGGRYSFQRGPGIRAGKLYLLVVLLLSPYFSALHMKMMVLPRHQVPSCHLFTECVQYARRRARQTPACYRNEPPSHFSSRELGSLPGPSD